MYAWVMAKVHIYTMNYCPYWVRAKQLLDSKSIAYTEEHVAHDNLDKWDELEKLSGMKTMPQIFIDEKCVGGYTELAALNQSGELDQLLKE